MNKKVGKNGNAKKKNNAKLVFQNIDEFIEYLYFVELWYLEGARVPKKKKVEHLTLCFYRITRRLPTYLRDYVLAQKVGLQYIEVSVLQCMNSNFFDRLVEKSYFLLFIASIIGISFDKSRHVVFQIFIHTCTYGYSRTEQVLIAVQKLIALQQLLVFLLSHAAV